MARIAIWLCLAACLRAQPAAVPWSGYAHDPQHSGLSTIGAQRLERIKWSTPVDLVLANTPGDLYIHYGSPLVTAGNTVLVPVRTSASNTYRVEAHSGADGMLLYTLNTDFAPPPHNWIPVYSPALSQGARLYYPGAGARYTIATSRMRPADPPGRSPSMAMPSMPPTRRRSTAAL